MTMQTRLLTDKNALNHTRTDQLPLAPLQPGEALLRVDRVAVTTNNITYAAFGDAMQYWDFFPTGEAGWGHMPVWGFAEVVASDVEGVAVGERFYGYWPIASHLRMQPVRVTARGFYDGAEHRQGLTSAYNQYTRTSADPAYRAADENYQMLVRPLFITSFMLADFLQDNGFFGARRLLFSSASSKTAYGTAFCLGGQEGIEQVGLTSARNSAFVQGLGCATRAAWPTANWRHWTPACPRCTWISRATRTCAHGCTGTSVMRWSTTATRDRPRTRISCATPPCLGRRRCSISRRCRSESAMPTGAPRW